MHHLLYEVWEPILELTRKITLSKNSQGCYLKSNTQEGLLPHPKMHPRDVFLKLLSCRPKEFNGVLDPKVTIRWIA